MYSAEDERCHKKTLTKVGELNKNKKAVLSGNSTNGDKPNIDFDGDANVYTVNIY